MIASPHSSSPSDDSARKREPRLHALSTVYSMELQRRQQETVYKDVAATSSTENVDFSDIVQLSRDVDLEELCSMGGSPAFHSHIDSLTDDAIMHKQGIKIVLESCEQYLAAGRAYAQAGLKFADELRSIPNLFALDAASPKKKLLSLGSSNKKTSPTVPGVQPSPALFLHRKRSGTNVKKPTVPSTLTPAVLEKAISVLSSSVADFHVHLDVMVSQQTDLMRPLIDKNNKDINKIKEARDRYDKSADKHRKIRREFQKKRGGDNAMPISAVRELASHRFDLAVQLGTITRTKHLSYLEYLCNLVHLHGSLCNSGDRMIRRRRDGHLDGLLLELAKANEEVLQSLHRTRTEFAKSFQTHGSAGDASDIGAEVTFRKTATGMAGYLNKQSKTWKNKWMRRWFKVDGKSFFYTKDEGEEDRLQEFDLTLASVRPARKSNRDFCFEVVSSSPQGGMRIMTFQASGKVELQAWMSGIADAIAGALDHVVPSDVSGTPGSTAAGTHLRQPSSYGKMIEARDHQIEVLSSAPGNRTCCECGSAKDVEWLSLNLCVIFCLECAGVHRALGVHISQCRSFKLDVLDHSILECFASLGNERANAVWEADPHAIPGLQKPTPGSSRELRERWIRAKYEERVFLGKALSAPGLINAAASGDMEELLRCLAWKENIDTINEHGATALGAAAQLGHVSAITLLLLNGADVNECDQGAKWTPLHAAAYGGKAEAARILIAKGADMNAKEVNGATPIDIVRRCGHTGCLEIMGGETLEDKDEKPLVRISRVRSVDASNAPSDLRVERIFDGDNRPPPRIRLSTERTARRRSWQVAATNAANRRRKESMDSEERK
jgi:hypothetical protein